MLKTRKGHGPKVGQLSYFLKLFPLTHQTNHPVFSSEKDSRVLHKLKQRKLLKIVLLIRSREESQTHLSHFSVVLVPLCGLLLSLGVCLFS